MIQLDQNRVLELISKEKNILTDKWTELQKNIKTATCPVCSEFDNTPVLDITKEGRIQTMEGLPKFLSKCKNCATVFEPNLRLVYSLL